jgi:hypothetical protein
MAKDKYTLFEGDINAATVELIKASEGGRKSILMNSQTVITGIGNQQRLNTTYAIIFEKTEG